MKTKKVNYPLSILCDLEDKINTNPDYQRPAVWTKKQKQLLMDTILRNYDIPKIYWTINRDDPKRDFDVVDGQQRLRAIWGFRNGDFTLAQDMDPINGIDCAGKKYDDLHIDIKTIFNRYDVDMIIVEEAVQNKKEDEIKDMFLRLQNGTTLKAQEKRNAMTGDMRNHVKKLAEHQFFENCHFGNVRYNYDHVTAQLICIELKRGPTNIQNTSLDRMYKEHKIFTDETKKSIKKVKKVLTYLLKAFPDKTQELESYNVINLYCLASILVESYVYEGVQSNLHDWFMKFEADRNENAKLEDDDEEQKDIELLEYQNLIGSATDSEATITKRVDFLEERFFLEYPDILLKDGKRSFSREQRLAIYRKNDGKCQLKIRCDGNTRLAAWGKTWHADHIIPHSKGGQTTVANGQVACQACNLAKSDKALV